MLHVAVVLCSLTTIQYVRPVLWIFSSLPTGRHVTLAATNALVHRRKGDGVKSAIPIAFL